MNADLADTINSLAADFREFKAGIDQRITAFEARANRPQLLAGGEKSAAAHGDTEQAKAFTRWLRHGQDADLAASRAKAMSGYSGTGADGGYAVPQDLDRQVSAVALNYAPIRQLATVVQVASEKYERLISLHGTAASWVGETDARPVTATPQLADIKPSFGEVYANPTVTQRLLDDAFFDVSAWLADEVGQQFGLSENAAFTSGNGTNQPKGILAYALSATPSFGQLKQVKSGVAGGVVADKLFDAVHSLRAPYRIGAAWQMPTLTVSKVRQLKDSQGRYLFEPSLAAGVPSTLLGFPVFENEDLDPATVLFGNWKRGYLIADVMGVRVLRDPFTNKPNVNFYTTKRVGGCVLDSNAIVVHSLAV
jgi:HK97 family phage major capsid protein